MPSLDIEFIKAKNPIQDVIAETHPLHGHGRYLRWETHKSLVVDLKNQAYFDNAAAAGMGPAGDVVSWVQARDRCDFKDAIETLCRRAGLPAPEWSGKDSEERVAARKREDALTIAARIFVRRLRASQEAMAYARGRGWSDETIQAAGLGYTGTVAERDELRGEFQVHGIPDENRGAMATLRMPAGMLVYPHVRGGRVRYLSGRGVAEKWHYNLDAELVGPRQRYFNHAYHPGSEVCVVVEGQADAVTLAQWDVPAVALVGTSADESLIVPLQEHQRLYVGLDADGAGLGSVLVLAAALGPLTRILRWPAKDANDWLQALAAEEATPEGMTAQVAALLDEAETYVEQVCASAGATPPAKRDAAMKEAIRLVATMDDYSREAYVRRLSQLLRVDLRQFRALLKVALQEAGKAESDEIMEQVETAGGWFGEHLLELLYDPEERETKFAVRYPSGEVGEIHMAQIEGVKYMPLWASPLMTKRVLLLPSAVGEFTTVRELQRRVRAFIHKYLDVDSFYERLASFYVLFTWMYDSFEVVPYLRALGDYGTGKTRFLQTIGAVCYRPTFVSGATTTSPIFRLIDMFKGTLVIDESDFSVSDAAADIVKILNNGNARGMPVLRSGSDRVDFAPEAFEVYGPKLIATRKLFTDRALESRCLTKEMGGPTLRMDVPMHVGREFWEEALALRNSLLAYRLRHWKPQIDIDERQRDKAVEPRLNQVVVGLKTLIEDEELRADISGFVREYHRQMLVERSMTLAAKVLEVILAIRAGPAAGKTADGEDYWDLSLKAITQRVNALVDEENEADEEQGDDKRPRKKITPRRIGSIVRGELQLPTARVSWGGGRFVVEWDDERIAALRLRFGVSLEDAAAPAPAPGANGEGPGDGGGVRVEGGGWKPGAPPNFNDDDYVPDLPE